jgi:MFS family permease
MVEAVLMTLSTTLIGDYFKGEARNRWLAAQTGVASFSAILIIKVAGLIGQRDWHNVFLMYLLPVVFLIMLVVFTWEPDESEHLAEPGPKLGWRDLPWKTLGGICLITLLGSIMFYTVQIKLPNALNDLGITLPGGGYDSDKGSNYIDLASIFVPVGTVCFWWLSPRTSVRTMLLVEFGLMSAGFLLMSRLSNPLHFAAAAGLNQIGAGMLLPTLLTWAVSGLPFELRGRGTGVWNSTFALGQFACNNAAIPLIMGFTGAIIPTIGVLGWICLAAAMIALAFRFAPRAQTA